mmetsp:Transcript_18413/g.51974  ORF Transcript_18413/g.51974 Transcript_18413/m.51974 type:complete len:246 (-) Transcript_18413:78-815(-)
MAGQASTVEMEAGPFEEENEYFGFHPLTFVDCVLDVVTDITDDMGNALSNNLQEYRKGKKAEVEAGTARLLDTLRKVLQRNFDKFELYTLANILNVSALRGGPDMAGGMSLPEGCSSIADVVKHSGELDGQLRELQKRVVAARFLNMVLKAHHDAHQDLMVVEKDLRQSEQVLGMDTDSRSNEMLFVFNDMVNMANDTHRAAMEVERQFGQGTGNGEQGVEQRYDQDRENVELSTSKLGGLPPGF